jgi:hypothetical protein
MNERDVKLQGIEVHRRDMAFVRGYVSCNNCACNYGAHNHIRRDPVFCQIYSLPIDPANVDENILRAESCEQWVFEQMDRNKVVTPDHTYRYDKWGD